jgi:hypothetical protein
MNKKQSKHELARVWPALAMMATIWLAGAAGGLAADPAAPAKPAGTQAAVDGTAVLDHSTLWRFWRVTGPSRVRKPDGKLAFFSLGGGHQWGTEISEARYSALPGDWAAPAFDDSAWPRERLPQPLLPELAPAGESQKAADNPIDVVATCLRARFEIKDPAKVKSCRLSMDYWGGVVVFVNGKEALRRHIQSGGTTVADTLVEDYPVEAWTNPDGKLIPIRKDVRKEIQARVAQRDRRLRDVEIPSAVLRSGTNVVAIMAFAAPIDVRGLGAYWDYWPPIGVLTARLTVEPVGAASGPRPQAIHVWNVAAYDTVTAFDYGDPSQPLRPIVVRAGRNTVFSGRLMVSSDQPIKGLKVTVTDLPSKAGAKIPAAAVRVRYAAPATADKSWCSGVGTTAQPSTEPGAGPHRFDGLLAAIPAEIPVLNAVVPVRDDRDPMYPFSDDLQSKPKSMPSGAMAGLWFTVRVPRDTAPGFYEGRVTVAAEGLPATSVPLQVQVSDWTAPDPKDFMLQNTLYYAEEVQAKYYGVPYYSDRHLELIGKVMGLASEINSRQVHINLGIDFFSPGGSANPETLVRWIKQPDGSFKHDFTIFNKYLDMVAKTMGKPNVLRLNCWGEVRKGRSDGRLAISVLDSATGTLSSMMPPAPCTEEGYKFWKPVFDEVLKRLKDRGWLEEAALGYHAWSTPPGPELVEFAHKLWPGGEWSCTSHQPPAGQVFKGTSENVRMVCRRGEGVRDTTTLSPAIWELDGPRRNTSSHSLRWVVYDNSPLREYRRLLEVYILGRGFDGTGEWGLDLFPLKRPAGGYMWSDCGRGTLWASRGTTRALLFPGPDGTVGTERFEMLREGLELCEARLFIQHAAFKKQLSPELQKRVGAYVAERNGDVMGGTSMTRYMQADEDARLLDLAGEVAREVERKR